MEDYLPILVLLCILRMERDSRIFVGIAIIHPVPLVIVP